VEKENSTFEKLPPWVRSPFVLGAIIGWLVGMLWWTGLMVTFAIKDGVLPKLVIYAPLVAIPWAAMGLLVGTANAMLRGNWVPTLAALGTLGGGVYSAMTDMFDGWLVITMPIACLSGTFIALVVSLPTRIFWGLLMGYEDFR
jgi:hypothetical protein